MITILNGKLTIPENERFIGFAGDNLIRTIEFLIVGKSSADRIYRLYLTFDDGTVNYFTLPSETRDGGVVLTWQVLREHIFRSGVVKAQIKAFSDNGVVYHTTADTFIVGDSAEFSDGITNQNTEFLQYEETLNNLNHSLREVCVLMPYIGDNGNWYIYSSTLGEYIDSGKPSVGFCENAVLADGSVTSEKLSDGAIDRLALFTEELRKTYLSLPLIQKGYSGTLPENLYNTLTDAGIYQIDNALGTHEVLVVLKPASTSFVMQMLLRYNQILYRGIWCTEDGVYADEDWEEWTDITSPGVEVDTSLDAKSDNPISNSAVAAEITALVTEVSAKQAKSITDEGEYFVSEDVESVLQEIGAELSELNLKIPDDFTIGMHFMQLTRYYTDKVSETGGVLAKWVQSGWAGLTRSHWSDLPDIQNSSDPTFFNFNYTANYAMQVLWYWRTGNVFYRIVNRKNASIYQDWKALGGSPEPMKVLAVGDSICRGVRNSSKGFVGDLGLPYKNVSVSGSTISNQVTSARNIPDQLTTVSGYTPDIIIAEGGINDYFYDAPLGTLSHKPATTDEEAAALDRSTLSGAMEYLFYQMIKLYPKAQRFFVITHKTWKQNESIYCPATENAAGWTQQDLHDLAVRCCNLYNVKAVDVYDESMVNSLYSQYRSEVAYSTDNSVTNTEYIDFDGVHPLAYGYTEAYVPLIKKAIGIGTAK